MLIKEAIKMLQRMNPNEEVFLQFKEDVTEYRNNEHLKNSNGNEHPCGGSYESQADRFGY